VAAKKLKKIKVKKRCCDSKRMCTGCPLRPENQKRRPRKPG
jgi:hypothetical protein